MKIRLIEDITREPTKLKIHSEIKAINRSFLILRIHLKNKPNSK